MPRRKLRLYVWPEYRTDYTSGMAFAIAHSEDQARAMVTKKYDYKGMGWSPDFGPSPEVYELKPIAFEVGGGA